MDKTYQRKTYSHHQTDKFSDTSVTSESVRANHYILVVDKKSLPEK
ncbi:MAG: hypothetical protein WCJ45_09100 [bacterium]